MRGHALLSERSERGLGDARGKDFGRIILWSVCDSRYILSIPLQFVTGSLLILTHSLEHKQDFEITNYCSSLLECDLFQNFRLWYCACDLDRYDQAPWRASQVYK
ncbi:hypothetical protein JEQ12_008600 [Ovis aries]|uniref:Uncharacterized protein n=1 Tax=Ovis aries TaxID=9940 RepID=A0A835ZQA7_SHEEP|nr:hypothetical protein JEQ12_008600 [Ovis aries]